MSRTGTRLWKVVELTTSGADAARVNLSIFGRGQLAHWLRGGPSDRARYVDMHARSKDAPLFGAAVGGSTVLAAATYGWWLVSLPVLAAVVMGLGMTWHTRTDRPEVVGAVTFALLELDIAISVLLTGGGSSPLLALMLIPVFTQAVCFPPQVTLVWTVLCGLLSITVIYAAERLPQAPDAPAHLQTTCLVALLSCLALAARYLADADVHSRDEAVIDPLTGLFNRKALQSHFSDARARAQVTGAAVAVVMCDLDHFKTVNDVHGHELGDAVLRQLAQRLLASVRATDFVYRMGGEEFLVLMPGHDSHAAARAAERLRCDVASDPVAGLAITISAGVASACGEDINFSVMTRAADAALYTAKRAGRDRVHTAPATP